MVIQPQRYAVGDFSELISRLLKPVSLRKTIAMESRNARIGMWLFLFYTLFYTAFVLTNAFAPTVMEATPVAGLNLAILSGFGLILLALVVALAYGYVARNVHEDIREDDSEGQS